MSISKYSKFCRRKREKKSNQMNFNCMRERERERERERFTLHQKPPVLLGDGRMKF
jgi:hypothetical protein